MNMTQANISRFFGYFSGYLGAVSQVESPSQARLFKKTLYLVIIDTLSKCRYPGQRSNSKRFSDFVRGFGDWCHHDRVSLLQLRLYLDSQACVPASILRGYASQQVDALEEGSVHSAEIDPTPAQLSAALSGQTRKEREWIKKNLRYFSHLMLLWKYRNMLIHEGRSPGHGVEVEEDEDPLYTSTTDSCKWELVFPEAFFHRVAASCIENLCSYCKVKEIDPYDSYSFESAWVV